MCSKMQDMCVMCSKIVKECHKNIKCSTCSGYVHKKCTKLKPKEIKNLNPGDWTCTKCNDLQNTNQEDHEDTEIDDLGQNTFNITDVDFTKYALSFTMKWFLIPYDLITMLVNHIMKLSATALMQLITVYIRHLDSSV